MLKALSCYRTENETEKTGGYNATLPCLRALQDALAGLYHTSWPAMLCMYIKSFDKTVWYYHVNSKLSIVISVKRIWLCRSLLLMHGDVWLGSIILGWHTCLNICAGLSVRGVPKVKLQKGSLYFHIFLKSYESICRLLFRKVQCSNELWAKLCNNTSI